MYSTNDYIKKANSIHNNKYDYSLLKGDIFSTQKIEIICPEHGVNNC